MSTHEPVKLGQLFRISDGDGDQRFFGAPKIVRFIHESWFPGTVGGQDATLFQVEGGSYKDAYVALTTNTQAGIKKDLEKRGYASVVVYLIRDPSCFDGTLDQVDGIGKGIVERLREGAT